MAGAQRSFDGPTSRDIAAMLRERTEELAFALFPAAVKAGGLICIGSVHGEAGDSLKIYTQGTKRGGWADYAADPGDRAGKGDMLGLIALTVAPPQPGQHAMANAVRWAKGWLGIESMDPAKLERFRESSARAQRKAELARADEIKRSALRARNMWLAGTPLTGTPAIRYLEGRAIDFAAIGRIPGALRFRHDVGHQEYQRKVPALLTAGIALSGQHAVTHATYLDRRSDGSWGKLPDIELPDGHGELRPVKCAKKIFGQGKGQHFPILKGPSGKGLKDMPAGERLYISEGLEDALTFAMARPDARIVMAGTLGRIGSMDLPPQCGDVVILAQRDAPGSKAAESFEKQVAALQALARAQRSNRRVLLQWPGEGFKDLNDELRGVRL